MYELTIPLQDLSFLKAGDEVLLSGVIFTARDAAHQRLVNLIKSGEGLPFPIEGAVIYYVGPCPAKPREVIGSAGPTTSTRMDGLTIPLLEKGLKGMIGKGGRSPEVEKAIQEHGAVYFAAIGGAGAYIAQCIKEVEVIAYPDLGPEAVHRMVVENLPLIVAIDSHGGNIYRAGVAQYRDPSLEEAI